LLRETFAGLFGGIMLCLLGAALPGILTNSVELYRVLLTFPLFTILAAMGAYGLMAEECRNWRLMLVFLLMVGSMSLDINNFANHYCNTRIIPPDRQWRNVEYFDAYNILRDFSRKEGPLYIFSTFNTDYDNKTLDFTCIPFDALHNPSLSRARPRWVALIINIQYKPYFIKNFHVLRFKVLNTDKKKLTDPKPFGLFLIPTSQFKGPMLANWMKADEIYREVDFQVNNKKVSDLWAGFLSANSTLGDQYTEDPFLTAVYWEKMGFFKFLDGYFIQATEAYRNAIQNGIPASQLYYDLGFCLQLQNKMNESRKCFGKASLLSVKLD
jgi:hypothetical protein